MNVQRKPVHRRLTIGVATVLAAVAAWGAAYLSTTADTQSGAVITNPGGDDAIASSTPTAARGNLVLLGDPDAVEAFATVVPSGALTALPANGDPVTGTFSPVADWPLVGIHAVLTPDGRVLSYGTSAAGVLTGYYIYDVWDPQLGLGSSSHTVLANSSAVDIFCNAQLLLPNGNIEMWGGDITNLSTGKSLLEGNDDSNVFNPLDNSLIRTGKMWRKRWYATATTLPNGEVYIQGGSSGNSGSGGGKDFPEVRTSTGQFRLLTGASTDYLNAHYPRNFLAPDGKIFGLHYSQMYRVDPSGAGTLARVGKFSKTDIGGTSTSVMFRPGKILQLGGGLDVGWASPDAHVVDINPYTPVITTIPRPAYRRHWADATVLPDGRVFVSGGSTADNDAVNGVAYTSEIYDPVANTWSTGATAQRMRLYHSTALLLPDATVLTLGGGANGPQLNLNAEVYYPPYLFKADGTPAPRPIIASLPMTLDPSQKLRIGIPAPADIARVTMVKTGSVTHSIDMDQRFLELPFTVEGDALEAQLPSNAFLTPPGFYMVFVINDQGVPSEAAMTRINAPGSQPALATLTVRKIVVNDDGGSKTASNFSFSVNGAAPVAFNAGGSNLLGLPAGTYTVTEPAVAGYAASLSGCSGIVLAEGGSATCTITNDDEPPTASPGNLIVNGDFETNSVPDGSGQLVSNLLGWKNKPGTIEVWRNNFGYTPGLNSSYIEIDGAGGVDNRVYQDIATVAAATYDLSFLHSPRPGNSASSNRMDVYWNGTRIFRVWIDGTNLTDTSWRRVNLVVTGTGGNDRLSFRESIDDVDDRGALVDDVQLTRR